MLRRRVQIEFVDMQSEDKDKDTGKDELEVKRFLQIFKDVMGSKVNDRLVQELIAAISDSKQEYV